METKPEAYIEIDHAWAALALAARFPCTPEQAIAGIETGKIPWGLKDQWRMKKLKDRGLTYAQVGRIFGLTDDAVYIKIRRLGTTGGHHPPKERKGGKKR